ncbi:MAG TPA: extracellular solute-binding protein [Mycobacteriales bacterium]|nr:extracellular solute-binding protein [Mycobacteriales bacterium]
MTEHSLSRRSLLRAAPPLAVLGAVGTGCAKSTVEGTPTFGLTALPTTPSPTPTTSPSPEHVELALWLVGFTGQQQSTIQNAVNSFSAKNSDITVTTTTIDYATFLPKLQTSVASGRPPDVLQYWPDATYIRQGFFGAVDDLIGSVRSDYLPGTLENVTFKNQVYGVPVSNQVSFLAYRKSVLSQAHLEPPGSLDDLVAAARKLTNSDRKGINLDITPANIGIGGPILWSAGADYLTDDHEPGFTTDRARAAISRLQHMVSDDSIVATAAPGDLDPFLTGAVAMQWVNNTQLSQLSAKFGNDLGLLPFPRLDGAGAASVAVFTTSLVLGARSEHADQASKLISALGVENGAYLNSLNFTTGQLAVPPRRSIASSASQLRHGAGQSLLTLAQKYGRADGRPDWTGAMVSAYWEALRKIISNHADPKATLDQAAQTVRTQLKQIYR